MTSTCLPGLAVLLGLLLPFGAAADNGPDIRYNIVLPAKPTSKHVLHVCTKAEVPDCLPSLAKALARAPREQTRIVVHCGYYRGDTADLTGFTDLVIEGAPCPNGKLPVLDAQNASTLRLGAFPWLGAENSKNLWVESLEFHTNHVGGVGTPFRLAGSGFAMFKNIYSNENDNGLVVDPQFTGTVYVVDSLFRENGYGRRGRTHHINVNCGPPCRLVVLDSYFGKVLQGGNHLRSSGHVYAIGNMFIDEVGGVAGRMINTADEACAMRSGEEPPCVVAENFMLKNQAAEHREFVNAGNPGRGGTVPRGMVVRDNVALGLRETSVLVGNKEPNAALTLRGNVLVVKDPHRCGGTGVRCLLAIPEFGAKLENNLISGDPDDLPTLYTGKSGPR
jgi:hypothetical protein